MRVSNRRAGEGDAAGVLGEAKLRVTDPGITIPVFPAICQINSRLADIPKGQNLS